MFRSIDALTTFSKLIKLNVSTDFVNNITCTQCVRWSTKPRWLPVAKSKLFRIPERPKPDKGEELETMRLNNRYRTHMRAIRHYLQEENKKTSSKSITVTQEAKDEEEEHLRCMKENEIWNQQVALIREERLRKLEEAKKEKIRQKLEIYTERQKQEREHINELVRKEKERAKFYITPENIDQAIENALATTVDHNFAIDLDGNIYRGCKTKPSDVPPDEVEKIEMPAQAS